MIGAFAAFTVGFCLLPCLGVWLADGIRKAREAWVIRHRDRIDIELEQVFATEGGTE